MQAKEIWGLLIDICMKFEGSKRTKLVNWIFSRTWGSKFTTIAVPVDRLVFSTNCVQLMNELKSKVSFNFFIKFFREAKFIYIAEDQSRTWRNDYRQTRLDQNFLEKVSQINRLWNESTTNTKGWSVIHLRSWRNTTMDRKQAILIRSRKCTVPNCSCSTWQFISVINGSETSIYSDKTI